MKSNLTTLLRATVLSMCITWLPIAALAYTTAAVSEEDPPATCDIDDAIDGATCYGDYCDNTSLECADTNYPVLYRYWSDNFSEESGGRTCGVNEIMTGISCSGSYCDNVSIECSASRARRITATGSAPSRKSRDPFISVASMPAACGAPATIATTITTCSATTDPQTRSLLQTGQPFPKVGSLNAPRPTFVAHADGSATVSFGPHLPSGIQDGHWIPTVPGKGSVACLRLYGSLKPFCTKK